MKINSLTLVFLILKLTHVIDWSWFFVLLPSILGYTVSFAMIALMATVAKLTGAKVVMTKRNDS